MAEQKYLTAAEVSQLTGLSRQTLANWRHESRGLPYHKVGAAVRYSSADVEIFFRQHRIDPEQTGASEKE